MVRPPTLAGVLCLLVLSGCWSSITDPESGNGVEPQPVGASPEAGLKVQVQQLFADPPGKRLKGWLVPKPGWRQTRAALELKAGRYDTATQYVSEGADCYVLFSFKRVKLGGTPRDLPTWFSGPGHIGYISLGAFFPIPFSNISTYKLVVAIYGSDRVLIGREEHTVQIKSKGLWFYSSLGFPVHGPMAGKFVSGWIAQALRKHYAKILERKGRKGYPIDPHRNAAWYLFLTWKWMDHLASLGREMGVAQHYLWDSRGREHFALFLNTKLGHKWEKPRYWLAVKTRGPDGTSYYGPELHGKKWLKRYAVVAYPKEYKPGLPTYVLLGGPPKSGEGAIYQKDLGPNTKQVVRGMDEFGVMADGGWQLVLKRAAPLKWLMPPVPGYAPETKTPEGR